ncbi:hypothetical protein AB0F81_41600 [Actinoplanes sp. NPDC024001]|uniref:hypothetical protein n=1 Tax=Actinoplanes sp. NPDC024001 TaxID=3154598 RepID=UPI0033EC91A2
MSLRDRLRHVHWIGGGPGGGKSTMAARLAERHGMLRYSTDDTMRAHGAVLTTPYVARFKAMTMDERWVTRTPEEMLETFPWFRGEGFDLIVEDLLRMPAGAPVVVEGFRLLPHLVAPLLADLRRAIWLLPTAGFRRAALDTRGFTWTIPNQTSDPPRAVRNMAERDRMFVDRLVAETARLGLRALRPAPGLTEDQLYEQVAEAFGLPGNVPAHDQRPV